MSDPLIAATWCPSCETATVAPITLGLIEKDGRWGDIAGFACLACGEMWKASDAKPIYKGRLTLYGLSVGEWLETGLRALGCWPPNPTTRPRGDV
jgi:hypothetical protein